MKTKYYTLLLILFLGNINFLNAQGENIFTNDNIHEVYLTFENTNFWNTLTSNYDNNYPDVPYIMANAVIDGVPIDSIGVRLKGFSSYWVLTDKKSIKLDFNEFVPGKKYDGLKKINLNNGEGDPAVQRDKLCYDILRNSGVDVPRTAYTKVYLNGEYWGLYLLLEQVDKTFLNQNFSNPDGNLFKNMANSELEWFGSDTLAYQEIFELKTDNAPDAWNRFVNLMDVINNTSNAEFKTAISEVFDVNLYLKILAVDVATNNWDSYIDHGRNFYLYEDPVSLKFKWIPWDYNLAIDGQFSSFDIGFDITFPINMENSQKTLISRLLAVPEFQEQYYKYWCALLDNNMTTERIFPMIDASGDLIRDAIYEDSNYMWTIVKFEEDLDQGNNYITGLKKFFEDRTTELNAEIVNLFDCSSLVSNLAFQDITINEFMASNDSLSGLADQDGEYDDWIELFNNTTDSINLSNAYLSDDMDDPLKWAFPSGTFIGAGEYLIVWADSDEGQAGLHSNFKLNKSGDFIILTNYNQVLDSITFSQQVTNLTYSRIPNGTGDFIIQQSSFSDNNEIIIGTDDLFEADNSVSVFPNPAKEVLNVVFEKIPETGTIISIYNSFGQRLLRQDVRDLKTTLLINNLSSGMYLLAIDSQEGKRLSVKKVMVY